MDVESLNKYWDRLKKVDIPVSSCIKSLSLDFHQTDCIGKTDDKTSKARLIISVWPVAPKCPIQDCAECATNIIKGKCPDEFVIENIYYELFPDKCVQEEMIVGVRGIQPLDNNFNYCATNPVFQAEYYITNKSPDKFVTALTKYTGDYSYNIGAKVPVQKIIHGQFCDYKNYVLTDVVRKRLLGKKR